MTISPLLWLLRFINLKSNYLSYSWCSPTGCVAQLTNGATHHQLFNIPTGRKSHMTPKDWNEKKATLIIAKYDYWKNNFLLY